MHLADEGLMQIVRSTGRQLFGDNCAVAMDAMAGEVPTTPT